MTERKKKIIALSIAASLMAGLSSCKKQELDLKINNETKQEELIGLLYENDLDYCYIVETNELNIRKLYFVFDKTRTETNIIDIVKMLCNTDAEIISILPFEYFVDLFGEEKNVYTTNDINMILHEIEKEYSDIKKDEEVKKLELKNK